MRERDGLALTSVECSQGSWAWEMRPPEPGSILMNTTNGEALEIVTIERNEETGGWSLLCARSIPASPVRERSES